MELSIIIVNWNTQELLEKCLDSVISDIGGIESEIIVVDNASKDGSVEMLQGRFPRVNLIVNRENPGFARANNQAIQMSKGRYVLLLNPDTIVKPGAVGCLLQYLKNLPGSGVAGPCLRNPDGSLQVSAYPRPRLFNEFWRMFHLDVIWPYANYPMHRWNVKQIREVDVLLGACMLLPRQALDSAGLFDESFFMYSEEVDLCRRLQLSGWKLFWVPMAEVVHYGAQSTKQVAEEMFLQLYHGKVQYFRKHYSWLVVQVYKLVLFFASLFRLALTPLAYLESPERRNELLSLSNYYRHLIGSLSEF
jgi:GT2 family glycosyltransferase